MNNEGLIRRFIRGSIQRAIQESIGALIVLAVFTKILAGSEVGSTAFYGCLLILVATGYIAGVVWSHALSYRLLESHPASDINFWREAFRVQARLLRLVPLWYCTPLGIGGVLFVTPTTMEEFPACLMVVTLFVGVFATVIWLNRRAATCLDETAKLLAD